MDGVIWQDYLTDAGGEGQKGIPLATTVPAGAWHRVTLDVLVGPPATVTVTIDSTVVLDAGALDPRFTNGRVKAAIGVTARSVAAASFHVDNVVLDLKP